MCWCITTRVPTPVFSEQALEFHRKGSLDFILQSWGSRFITTPLRRRQLEDFLSLRYGYWDDDVDHEDIFGM